jgi:hypothetical protein
MAGLLGVLVHRHRDEIADEPADAAAAEPVAPR